MVPQIIGTKRSKHFRACERYCRERAISYQHRDPIEKPLSVGEIRSIIERGIDPTELIDPDSKRYKERGMAWLDYDPVEEVCADPHLLRQPIVRTDEGVAIDPDRRRLDELFSPGR